MPAKKIVIVENEEEMAKLLKIELETENYQVFSAYEGDTGLDLIRKETPDLIILDVMMPMMSGYDVLKELKEDPLTNAIPVMMLTAKGLEEEVQKGLDLGAEDYILKPFHSALLIKRVQKALEK